MKLKVTQLMIERVVSVTLNWKGSTSKSTKKAKLQNASNLFKQSFGSSNARLNFFLDGLRELGFELPDPQPELSAGTPAPMMLLARHVRSMAAVLILNTKGGYVILDKDKPDTYDPDEMGTPLQYNKTSGLNEKDVIPIKGISRELVEEMLKDFTFTDTSCGSTTNVLIGLGFLEKLEEDAKAKSLVADDDEEG